MAIRVLMLLPSLHVATGTASFAMNYFRAVDPEEIRMDFAVWDREPSPYCDEIAARGGRVWRLPSIKKPSEHFRACKRILSKGNYDVVHDNTLLVSWPMMRAAARCGVPVRLLHSHSSMLSENCLKRWINRTLLPLLKQRATDYAACSGLAAKAMFGDAGYAYIPDVIDGERFSYSPLRRRELRSRLGVSDRIVVGTVARSSPVKNPLFAVEVMEKLIQRDQRVEYWWVGSGVMDDALKARVEGSEARGNIRLLGSREDVPDLYQAMDVFFLPSRFEGLMIAGVEAQTMGLPCVVSDVVPEELRFTDLIRYVDLKAPAEAWAQVLREQIERIPERRSYLAELDNSAFSLRNASELLLSCYRSALDRA